MTDLLNARNGEQSFRTDTGVAEKSEKTPECMTFTYNQLLKHSKRVGKGTKKTERTLRQ